MFSSITFLTIAICETFRLGRRTAFLIFTFLQFGVVSASAFSGGPASLAVLTFLTGTVALGNFVCAVLIGEGGQ